MGRSGSELRFESVMRSTAEGHGGDDGEVLRLCVWPVSHCGRCCNDGKLIESDIMSVKPGKKLD
jgi:hypothetical protein